MAVLPVGVCSLFTRVSTAAVVMGEWEPKDRIEKINQPQGLYLMTSLSAYLQGKQCLGWATLPVQTASSVESAAADARKVRVWSWQKVLDFGLSLGCCGLVFFGPDLK